MEVNRKSTFEHLRHKNSCSIDDLKLKLRKLYIKDLKTKREKILNSKRDIVVSEEDDVDFFKNFCEEFFGEYEEPWDGDEDLLNQIWEEIQLEEQENNELDLLESLLELKTTQQIICPICLKLPARLMKPHCVVCDCGFRFQLPSHISLKDFETSIITCSELHNMSCDSIPVFQIRPRYEVFEFYLSCEICLMTSIILETPGGTSGMDIQ